MELILISTAFLAGFIALRFNLPPLVGFLLAGFGLHAAGYQSNETIVRLADLGVTLLLFTIGLKLDVRALLSREIWAGATFHNLVSTLAFTLALAGFKLLGISVLAEMDVTGLLLLGFALSFSSTVFAVKALHEKGDMHSTYGTLAIGILVMQDILAVIFLTVSTGKVPEWYAIAVLALPFLRPVFFKALDWVGHDEMLVFFGVFLALVVGAGLFEVVGLKPDLGALLLGMLLAGHSKASELSKSLFNMKELFLVCFFLNIGLSAQLTLTSAVLGLLFYLLLPIKGLLYFLVINVFKFRVRTSFLTALVLFNYSEFGLIVAGLAYKKGWMGGDMLAALAVTVSLSFLIAAPINRVSHGAYRRSQRWLREHAAEKINERDRFINPGAAQVLILGMGRIGSGAYDELKARYGDIVLGVEVRQEAAQHQREQGRNVITGDATDLDFWERILDTGGIKLVLLAMPHHGANQIALKKLKARNFQGRIAAIAEYGDQLDGLMESGADAAFNIYSESGRGFARHVCEKLETNLRPEGENGTG